MTTERTEQSKIQSWGHNPESTGLRLFQPRIAFEEDNGTTATGTTGTPPEKPVDQTTTPPAKPTEKPVDQSSTEVRNPEKLLELYQAQKDELKELKAFKAKQDKAASEAEAKRLEEKGQYEAALNLKITEAVSPVNQMLEAERKKAEKLAADLAKTKAEMESLQTGYKTEKLKSAVNQAFTASNGDPDAADLLWSAYGSKFSLSEDGKPVLSGTNQAIEEYMKTLQNDPVGARLFKATVVEGTGTPPQNANGKGYTGVQPKVITQAEQMRSRDPQLLEKISKGEVIVKG